MFLVETSVFWLKKKKKKKKKALAHLVTGERGRRGADRMKYHLVGLNDNFISHLTFVVKYYHSTSSVATFDWTCCQSS